MSLKKYIRSVKTIGPFKELELDFKKSLKSNFAGSAARRMTDLALLIGEITKDVEIEEDDSVVYATTFSESRCLEKYLESFPNPSPLGFQNSIHPSGFEQVMIARKQPLSEFIPLAGREELSASALQAAFTSAKETQWVVFAEERSTWLTDIKFASETYFAGFLELTTSVPDQAIGSVELDKSCVDASQNKEENLLQLFRVIEENEDSELKSEAFGKFTFRWK